jgi:hypothetical protein
LVNPIAPAASPNALRQLLHGAKLDIRRIDHDDLPDVLAAILDAQPVAVQ